MEIAITGSGNCTDSVVVAALNVINKTGIKQVFLFSLLIKKAREEAVLFLERRLFDIMASEARLVLGGGPLFEHGSSSVTPQTPL